MKKSCVAAALAAALGAGCSPYPGYEQSVSEREPAYCYRSYGDHLVRCYPYPMHRDADAFVNYFGPAPYRYPPPPPPPPERLVAPPPVSYWVKDAEPIPQADPPKGPIVQAAPSRKVEPPTRIDPPKKR